MLLPDPRLSGDCAPKGCRWWAGGWRGGSPGGGSPRAVPVPSRRRTTSPEPPASGEDFVGSWGGGWRWTESQQSCPALGLRAVPLAQGVNSGEQHPVLGLRWAPVGAGVKVGLVWGVVALSRGCALLCSSKDVMSLFGVAGARF